MLKELCSACFFLADDEGRMESDANKSLNFVYNHLDLVKTASSGTEEVNFIWDATGRKLAKTFGGHITHYIGGVAYLDDVLISIATAEGIVRKTQLLANEGDWVYDYYLKDHLGNIRAVITEERSAIVSDKVTSEIVKRLQEEMGFDNVDETAGMAPYLYPYDPSDPDNEMVADLNAFTGRIIGPSKLMSVRQGETIDVSTNYWYHQLPGEDPITDITEILAGILLNMGAASNGVIPTGPEAGMALLNNVNGTPFAYLNDFLDDAFDEVDLTDPQAYLVYMFFDKNNMNIIAKKSGIIQVGEADQLGVISQRDLVMDRDGFFYVYVTNRSQLPVSFDNLEVKRWKPVVRVAYDYYPYGLTWENPATPGTEEGIHDCTYQDKEFQFGEFSDGHGLALYDFHARMYDGATGRWLVPDPAAQFANPYLAMGNNPVIGVDPDGCFVEAVAGAVLGAVVNVAMAGIQGNLTQDNWYKYAAVGALAGGFGVATGGGTMSMMGGGTFAAGFVGSSTAATASGFAAGAVSGAVGGLTSGFINGAGSGWIQNKSFGQSMEMGFEQGVIGGMIGFGMGGISAGICATKNNKNFWTGAKKPIRNSVQFARASPIQVQRSTSYSMVDGHIELNPTRIDSYLSFDGSSLNWYDNMSDGTINLSGSWSANSGPWGNGRLPNGEWIGSNARTRTSDAMVRNGVGFSVDLDPTFNTSRDLIRIHPDGNVRGTQGCIGLTGNRAQLNSFYDQIDAYFYRCRPSISVLVNY